MKDDRGKYCNGHKLTGAYPSTPPDMLGLIRFLIYDDTFKAMFNQLREDGKDLIDELRKDISVRTTEVWDLLHQDDRALIKRFIKKIRPYRWGWVLQRQEDQEFVNPIPWHKRIRSCD